ncbi:putative hydrolase of alpha/beta superfamily [Opitutaceae bacterium TAV1]|nr:putative hydrolase of alpha/beta superfamily [Opitutaceae bacterium TAV1]
MEKTPVRRTSPAPAFLSRSTALATDYHVFVEAPDASRHPGPWPVAVVVDGDYMFAPLVQAAAKLRSSARLHPPLPPVLLVGVGYGKSFGDPANRRGRDYTPTASAEEPGSGGADAFLAHLTGPLWAELARRYPVRNDLRLLAGHSLGGLFALHALFQPRPFFNRVLVGAPSLWWDDHRFLSRVARRQQEIPLQAPRHPPPAPVRLFLGIGAEDTESMTGDLARFERQLAESPIPGLETVSRTFPRHDHYNVLPRLFHDGLAALLR